MAIPERAFLRRDDVQRVTGLSLSTVYRLGSAGKFPKPVKLGERAAGWPAAEVQDWIDARMADARDDNR